jgi:hypothetical protein
LHSERPLQPACRSRSRSSSGWNILSILSFPQSSSRTWRHPKVDGSERTASSRPWWARFGGAALNQILPAGAWAVGLGILIAMLTCQLLRSPEGAKVAGFTCGIIVLQNSPDPWAGAFSRLIETALGVTVALLVSYLPKLIRIDESDNKIA